MKNLEKVQNKFLVDESVMVVKRVHLEPLWQGFRTENIQTYLDLINNKKEFQLRSLMELDQNFKQIIPYMIFKFEDSIFVMQRRDTASEQRLKNKFTVGIGGHVREEDISGNSVFDWAKREFAEEVAYEGSLDVKMLGLINDDGNDVGKVHIGLIFLLTGDVSNISIKSELKSGKLIKMADLADYLPNMENWSKLVIEFLMS